jgi:hypothetical protein
MQSTLQNAPRNDSHILRIAITRPRATKQCKDKQCYAAYGVDDHHPHREVVAGTSQRTAGLIDYIGGDGSRILPR